MILAHIGGMPFEELFAPLASALAAGLVPYVSLWLKRKRAG